MDVAESKATIWHHPVLLWYCSHEGHHSALISLFYSYIVFSLWFLDWGLLWKDKNSSGLVALCWVFLKGSWASSLSDPPQCFKLNDKYHRMKKLSCKWAQGIPSNWARAAVPHFKPQLDTILRLAHADMANLKCCKILDFFSLTFNLRPGRPFLAQE